MKILFITLEQSARQNLKYILNNNFFISNSSKIFTYGMNDKSLKFRDLTNIKIKSIMGITNIVYNLNYLFKLRSNLYNIINKYNFTHILFIDSFDFTKFYLNKYKCKNRKFCQIIGPSVFIWKKKKAEFINKEMDKIFSIFHIEEKFYKKNIYSYIGHPLLKNIHKNENNIEKISKIGFFLGSRFQEINKNIFIINDLIKLLSIEKKYTYYFFITKEFEKYIKNSLSNHKNIIFYLNNDLYYKNISKLDFAFACSGTVHLELSFSKIPHFIFYKANQLNYFIFKYFVKSKYLSLLNIFSNKLVVKEFIQNNFNSISLYHNFNNLIKNQNKFKKYRNNIQLALMQSNFSELNTDPIVGYLKKSFLTKED